MRVVNSYVNEVKEPQSTRSKVLSKYTPKDKRQVGQKALTLVGEIVNSLIASYTFPLRRIGQSMSKENLVIRTSLSNKRVVLRGSSSNPLIGASTSGAPSSGGPSSCQSRQGKGNKRQFVVTEELVNVTHEGGVLKGSFQGDTSENLHVSHDGGVLKAYAINDLVFTPQEQKLFSQEKQVQPRVSVSQRLGTVNEPK